MLSATVQATMADRFGNSENGRSKQSGKELFSACNEETGVRVAVYRFANLMGHFRPKYNSSVWEIGITSQMNPEYTTKIRTHYDSMCLKAGG